jgi:bacterial/archaeal transporter family-2 protein
VGLPALLLVLCGGVAFAVQAPINAALARVLGHGVAAAAVSFGVGFACLLAATLLLAGPGPFAGLSRAAPWMLVGGALGGFVVFTTLTGVPSLGVVTTVAALVAGQMLAALVLDATGAFGAPIHPIGWSRVLAVLMVGGGLVLSRL